MHNSLSSLFSDDGTNLRAKVIGIYLLLIGANVAAWLWALIAFHNYPILFGTATLAYTFGLRHAFDADHIAAIDNVTRKLMQEGTRPVAVGFFFSLGHSTIVVALSIAIAITATALQSRFRQLHKRRRHCRHLGLGLVPVRNRHRKYPYPQINLPDVPSREERRQVRGGRPRPHAVETRIYGAYLAPLFPPDRAQLAHVSAGGALWPWFRYSDRGWLARNLRDAGRAGHVDLVDTWCFRPCSPPGCH